MQMTNVVSNFDYLPLKMLPLLWGVPHGNHPWDCSWQWRHNGRDCVSNHQLHDCLLNRLFRRRSKKTSKFHVTGVCAGNSLVTGEFPTQMVTRRMFPFDDVIMYPGTRPFSSTTVTHLNIGCQWLKGTWSQFWEPIFIGVSVICLNDRLTIKQPNQRPPGWHTLPAKNMEYFLFQRFFAFLWGLQGVSVLEIHSYEQILLLGKLISP